VPLLPTRSLSILAFAAFLVPAAPRGLRAAEAPDGMREQILRMTEFFDTMLPGTVGQRNLTLHFTPKFSDFRDREYVRYPLVARYGVAKSLEVFGGLTPYSPNPINTGQEHRWGPGEVKLGLRYDCGPRLKFFDETTVGFETRIPVGQPPILLNDHYTHVKPFVSAAHTLNQWPDTTFYANLSYDRSVDLTHRSAPPREVVRRDVIEVVPGLLFKPGQFGSFAEYRFRHVSDEIDWYLTHEARIGAIWDVPLARSKQWRLPGKWQLEVAYKYEFAGLRGTDPDHGFTTRVSWRTTLREFFARPGGATTAASR
jgi:hypothetical protein